MANNLDRPERRIHNGSLSLNMRPFSFNFSAQCWGRPLYVFFVGFIIEDSKHIGGKRETFCLKKKLSSSAELLVFRKKGKLEICWSR